MPVHQENPIFSRLTLARAVVALSVFGATGCATSTSVKLIGDGLNVVSKSGRVSWDGVPELQKQGAEQAEKFCADQQRKAKIVDVKGFPAGVFDRSTRVETVFSCDADPG